jgi:hypothetical protein
MMWLAYASMQYKKALEVYEELMRMPGYNKELKLYKACFTSPYVSTTRPTKSGSTPRKPHINHQRADDRELSELP